MSRRLFPTLLYEAQADPRLLPDLARSIRALAAEDSAGRRWSRDHRYSGYTSYASLNDLPKRDPAIGQLARLLARHARAFAGDLAWQVNPRLDSLWVNLVKGGRPHTGHIHPNSILSGTVYVEVPAESGAIRFEDPRLPMMMAAPLRREDAPEELRPFVTVQPSPGLVLMWESWLRHEVLPGTGRGERLSISFNFA